MANLTQQLLQLFSGGLTSGFSQGMDQFNKGEERLQQDKAFEAQQKAEAFRQQLASQEAGRQAELHPLQLQQQQQQTKLGQIQMQSAEEQFANRGVIAEQAKADAERKRGMEDEKHSTDIAYKREQIAASRAKRVAQSAAMETSEKAKAYLSSGQGVLTAKDLTGVSKMKGRQLLENQMDIAEKAGIKIDDAVKKEVRNNYNALASLDAEEKKALDHLSKLQQITGLDNKGEALATAAGSAPVVGGFFRAVSPKIAANARLKDQYNAEAFKKGIGGVKSEANNPEVRDAYTKVESIGSFTNDAEIKAIREEIIRTSAASRRILIESMSAVPGLVGEGSVPETTVSSDSGSSIPTGNPSNRRRL